MISFFSQAYFGNTLTQYIIFFGILLAAVLLSRTIYWLFQHTIKRLTKKTRTRLDDIIIDMIEEPVLVFIILMGFNIGWQFLNFEAYPRIPVYYGHIFYMLLVLNVAWLIARLIDALVENYLKPLSSKSETKLDDHIIHIFRKLINIIVFAIAIIMILNHFGQEIGPMLAGLGIGGLALAFAAKDILSNIFGSATVLFDKPFAIGQRIRVGGYDGTVKEINIRTTKIETLDGTIIQVPNSKFTDSIVENVTREESRKVKINLGLTYDTNAAGMRKAKEILKDILSKQQGINNEKFLIAFTAFGDFSKNIMIIYWITNKEKILDTMDEINFKIMERFEKAKLEFAFPTQTVEIKRKK